LGSPAGSGGEQEAKVECQVHDVRCTHQASTGLAPLGESTIEDGYRLGGCKCLGGQGPGLRLGRRAGGGGFGRCGHRVHDLIIGAAGPGGL